MNIIMIKKIIYEYIETALVLLFEVQSIFFNFSASQQE